MNTLLGSTQATAALASANTYTDINGLAALKRAPGSAQSISAAAKQVEALFLQMVLKSMRDAMPAQGDLAGHATDLYQDMFDKQVALNLSQHQDLGIGAMLRRQLAGVGPRGANEVPAHVRTAAASTAVIAHSPAHFVAQVLPSITKAAGTLGVNPLGLLAQAALETKWGQHMPRTADGTPSHNLFGVKAGAHWVGPRVFASTVEFDGRVASLRKTAFRAYGSIDESVNDFANLLKNSERYKSAVAAGSSAVGFVTGIGKSGYATDPLYAQKLTRILRGNTLRSALAGKVAIL
jgi:flagellar protein FlgJ